MTPVAALFVLSDSIYKTLPGVECFDEERNALTFTGEMPVVAHPPCRLWGKYRHLSKAPPAEKGLAIWAIQQVRQCGGILEHPSGSQLWPELSLPPVDKGSDLYGGYTIKVKQSWWGHRAEKRTLLYICGVCRPDLPAMPPGTNRAILPVEQMGHHERSATPPAFAKWLVEAARRCQS